MIYLLGYRRTSGGLRDFRRNFSHDLPFGFQVPGSLRDPQGVRLSAGQLQYLHTDRDAHRLALNYLHDPGQFVLAWNSNDTPRKARRFLRILVQIQTINAVYNSFYRLPNNRKAYLDSNFMLDAALNTRQYKNYYKYDKRRQQIYLPQPAKIFVVDGDCIETVRKFSRRFPNHNPVVLNMADTYSPGGRWRIGAGAQEENLHRRSNLFQCLEDPYNDCAGRRRWTYPIPEFGGLYSPNVSVFRGSEAEGYPFYPNGPEYVSIISCAAYAYPRLRRNSFGEQELADQHVIDNTMRKMDAIFKIALDNEHDTVILSAFGCGAFRNPPKHIAKLFMKVIHERYSHAFAFLIFAILDDHSSMQSHNRSGNIKPFADVFRVPVLSINQL